MQRFFIIHNSVPVTPSQAGAATRTLRLKYRDPDDHHHDQCRHRVSTRDHTGIAAQSECEVRVPAAGIGKPGSGLRNRELDCPARARRSTVTKMLTQWRRLGFFDKEPVKGLEEFKNVCATTATSGRGQTILGDADGWITISDRTTCVQKFRGYDLKVHHLFALSVHFSLSFTRDPFDLSGGMSSNTAT